MDTFKFCILLCILLLFERKVLGQGQPKDSPLDLAYKAYKAHNFTAALAICKGAKSGQGEQSAVCLVMKGFVFTDSISFEAAKPFFEKAQEIQNQNPNGYLQCKIFLGMGKGYFNGADYPNAIKYFLKMDLAAVKAELLSDQKTARAYLGQCYGRMGKIPASNHYMKQAIDLAKQLKDSAYVIRFYSTLTTNFAASTTDDSSSFVYADSIILAMKDAEKYLNRHDPTQMGLVYSSFSNAYYAKGDLKKMKYHSQKAYEQYRLTKDTSGTISVAINLMLSFLELNQFDSALVLQQTIQELKKMDKSVSSKDERNFYYFSYRIYKGLGNSNIALSYLEKWYAQDLKYNEGKNLSIQEMREDFEAQKTSLQIRGAAEKTRLLYEQKRNFYFLSSGGILLLLFLSAWFVYYRFKTRKEQEERNLKMLLQNAELTALKAQMNPHFIFNALNSIQHSIISNNTEDAYRFLSRFSKLIRNVLDSSSEQLIPLNTEIETLTLYLEIESKRFDKSFSFEIETNEVSEPNQLFIPPMILQPFIENAIWHGLMPKDGEKKLSVSFSTLPDKSILCEINDNGIGRDQARVIAAKKGKNHSSKGIANIMDRVKLLEMTHSIKIEIDIMDRIDANGLAEGTTVRVQFLNQKNKK